MKILLFGGSGLVGSRFIDLNKEKFEIFAPPAQEVDILNKDQLLKAVKDFNPEVVINFAAFTDVQAAETQKGNKNGLCYKLNADGAKNVADACKEFGKYLIHISTDYVFDGEKFESSYTEGDRPNPQNWYGQTKYFGEQNVLESNYEGTIVRISMPFSAHHKAKLDVARFFLEQLKNRNEVSAIEDQYITPTFVDDISKALGVVIVAKAKGIYHVSSTTDTTPYKFAHLVAANFHLNASLIKPITLKEYNKDKAAPLLKFSRLDPAKFIKEFGQKVLHTVEESVKLLYINQNGKR